jgi:hypothetical protein
MISNKKKVLIVTEGKMDKRQLRKTAVQFFDYLKEDDYEIVEFKTSLYELYEPLHDGEADSLPALLIEQGKLKNNENLRASDMFALIYLIFDFDPLYHLYSEEKASWLCSFFNDETRNGLLYFNFPMVEALFDVVGECKAILCLREKVDLNVCSSECYKALVKHQTALVNKSLKERHPLTYLTGQLCFDVSKVHLARYFQIVGESDKEKWTQSNMPILLQKEIEYTHLGFVKPLSCFILMAMDYNSETTLYLLTNN